MNGIQKLWPNSTIVCLGNGPSLTREDVEAVRGKARVIAINVAVTLAPWADVLYAADARLWRLLKGAPDFQGLKVSIQPTLTTESATTAAGVIVMQNTGAEGLELSPDGLRHGLNGGYQAINLAVHLGATRILLLGYDMALGPDRQAHWVGAYRKLQPQAPYSAFRAHFKTLVKPLRALGVEVVNCSRQSALTCFHRQALDDVLREAVAA